jgi:iron complex transport system substrate-binding protein
MMKSVCLSFLILLWAWPLMAQSHERIITIGGALTEIVYALGAEKQLVGSDTTSYYPPAAEALPKVGYQRALSAEGILSLQPDAILLTEEAGPPAVLQQIESAGVELLTLKAGRSLEDVTQNIAALGKALQRQEEAAKLIETLQADAQKLQAATQHFKEDAKQGATPRKKVLFILQHGGGAPMVAGAATAADSIITLSGAENAVQDYEGYKPLTPEAAVALKPEVILTTTQGLTQAGGEEGLLQSPGLALTPAAKHGHIIAMDSLLLLGFGPRTVQAAWQLHKAYSQP